MTIYEIIAQLIGLIAMLMNLLSFQQKKAKVVIGFQLFGGLLFSINFFMLGAWVGAMLNLMAVFRALVFMNKEKTHANHKGWLIGFTLLFILAYVLSFTVFGKPVTVGNLIVEILPVIAMVVATYSFQLEGAKDIRAWGLVSSPLWLIYNICSLSVGAICCEALNILSIIVGMLRLDRKKA